MKRWNAVAVYLALAALTPLSHAQSDPDLIGWGDWSGPLGIRFPGALIENQPITIDVPSDGCFHGGPTIIPEATTIVRDGNSVTIDFHAYMMVCFSAGDPPGVWTYQQALGSFDSGRYAITARYHYVEEPNAAPFAVLAANMDVLGGNGEPAVLPTLSARALLLSALSLGIIGLIQIRVRGLRI